MTWTTITRFVDIETGEVLTGAHIEKGLYNKIKLTTKYNKTSKDYGYKYNTWQCEKNRQLKLEI